MTSWPVPLQRVPQRPPHGGVEKSGLSAQSLPVLIPDSIARYSPLPGSFLRTDCSARSQNRSHSAVAPFLRRSSPLTQLLLLLFSTCSSRSLRGPQLPPPPFPPPLPPPFSSSSSSSSSSRPLMSFRLTGSFPE